MAERTDGGTIRTDYDVMVRMRGAARDAGFEHFMVAAPVGPSDTSLRDLVRLTSWPPELVMGYDAAGLIETSRPAHEAADTALPSWWDLEAGDGADVQFDDDAVPTALRLFLDHGMPRHLAFTVADRNARRWVVSFSGTGTEPDAAGKAALQMVAVEVAEALRTIDGNDAPSIVLTERQREVMSWVAQGKSTGEIATILDIAEATVATHAEGACARLNAVNRTQAVAIAVREGII